MYIFVIGNQRSGTTFLYQLLVGAFKVGYISNLAARFPEDPVRGIKTHRELLGDERQISYRSEYGNTPNLTDPHEFGWFWRQYFNLEGPMTEAELDAVNWERLRRQLVDMREAWGDLPLVFKCAGMGFYAARVAQEIPEARFVYIERDLVTVAAETLEARRVRYGSDEAWYGFKPDTDLHDYYLKIIAEQVEQAQELIQKQAKQIPEECRLHYAYGMTANQPYDMLMDIQLEFSLRPIMTRQEPLTTVTDAEIAQLREALTHAPVDNTG